MITDRPIPGGWKQQTVRVAGRDFDLVLPANPDDVFYALEERPEASQLLGDDPYWSQLWPTSLRLAECVLTSPWPLRAKAIELGCGVGLVGLAAAAAGLEVTLTDYNPIAVELALENARRNGFSSAQARVLDWRDPPSDKFDVILASDVIYDRQLHAPLMHTLAELANPAATIWIGDGGRSATEEFVLLAAERFSFAMLDAQGRPAHDIHVGEYRRMIVSPRRR